MTDEASTDRPPRPTLRQVAALSGVSIKTVSRVLNGEPHVTQATAVKVRTAASQLGFRLNVLARELRAGATSTTVGLLIGDLANPFYSRMARGAERTLTARGLRLITASTDEDPDLEWALTQDMLDRRVRAVMVVPSSTDHTYLDVERRHGLPVVFIDRPPSNIVADTILIDNVAGARTATEHLLKHGHRRVAFVGDLSRLSTHTERMAGFRAAMERSGGEWERYARPDSHDETSAQANTLALLDLPTPPTALFTTNNRITTGALRALRNVADRQPDRVLPALVGFDDLDLGDVLGVTVMSHDPEEMGRLAAEAALERIDGAVHAPRTTVIPVTLVARGSGERAPAD
ncbi:MAG: LacI family transcriptional regulator [Frankiales bacterium]|nr:LacI family transcriptional regulator [Frankiales bacterium]